MPDKHTLILIGICALVTAMLRFIPFIIFSGKRKTPEFITYLGKVLPFAIIGMLVVFCLKGTSVVTYPYGIPEIIAVAIVVILHVWKRNTLLSIISGTVAYIVMVNFIFV